MQRAMTGASFLTIMHSVIFLVVGGAAEVTAAVGVVATTDTGASTVILSLITISMMKLGCVMYLGRWYLLMP